MAKLMVKFAKAITGNKGVKPLPPGDSSDVNERLVITIVNYCGQSINSDANLACVKGLFSNLAFPFLEIFAFTVHPSSLAKFCNQEGVSGY